MAESAAARDAGEARDAAEAWVPVGHLPLDMDDIDVAQSAAGPAQVRPRRTAIADVALHDLDVGAGGRLRGHDGTVPPEPAALTTHVEEADTEGRHRS